MQKFNYLLAITLAAFFITSCQMEDITQKNEIPSDVITKLTQLGFNPDGIEAIEEGYRIERDIIITPEFLASAKALSSVPNLEQYSTTNLVTTNGSRNITIYAPVGGRNGYSAGMIAGLDEAISRYNAENLEITFSRVTSSSGADIQMTRLKKGEERQGILGSAGFPTASGDPYGEIKMSGILESAYGLNADEIGTIIAHEMGHCIGLRHTDYFDRSISCGGSAYNEGTAGVGANHIPGTPTGATYSAQSYMLSCTDGSDRPFNNDDQTALDYLY
ncbi:MAG: protease B [Bacteroidetes bacterium]|nr:protease B [Bacteroidota bacterium]